jgi:hypothetical protein
MSNSGLSDFIDSPLLYWYKHINPGREPEEPTPAQLKGLAVHAAVLEPDTFTARYCQKFDAPEGCLRTVADLRAYAASEFNYKLKGNLKADLVEQLKALDPDAQIYDDMAAEYDSLHAGKVQFAHEVWNEIKGCASALRNEPAIQEALAKGGEFEKVYRVKYRGLAVRSRMDYVLDDQTWDLKTISRKRGEPFDQTVTRAIWHEGYYRQACFYSLVRSIARGDDPPNAQKAPRFIFAFVESSPPHETRIREMKPLTFGEVSLLWARARLEVETAFDSYAEHVRHFGEKQWRYAQEVEPLNDEEFPAVVFGR